MALRVTLAKITPAKYCKKSGLTGMKELCDATNQSRQCLDGWFYNKRNLFNIIIKGVLFEKQTQNLKNLK